MAGGTVNLHGPNTANSDSPSTHEQQTTHLIRELTEIWEESPNKRQAEIITTCRLILLDSIAVIIDGLFNDDIRQLEQKVGTIADGEIWITGLKKVKASTA